MENDEKAFIEDNYIMPNGGLNDIFKFEYSNQNIEKSKDYQLWKSKIKKNNQGLIRFYKCNEDKICFYEKVNNHFDYYAKACPKCQYQICCYCSKIIKDNNIFSRYIESYCCLKRLISFIFFREDYKDEEYPYISFILGYIVFIIPFTNILSVLICIIQNFFCLRKNKNHNYYTYHEHFRECITTYRLILLINLGFGICMTICYLIISYIFMLILFLFSIPFKLIPVTNLIFYVAENSSYSIYGCC